VEAGDGDWRGGVVGGGRVVEHRRLVQRFE
jgi:hypothetical protein